MEAASARAGEATWPLPMPEAYEKHIDSEVADMKNIGKAGQAGAISAALLLARFVGEVPWVHLDIAGPARSDDDDGVVTKGGTGFGVRTLLELLDGYGRSDAVNRRAPIRGETDQAVWLGWERRASRSERSTQRASARRARELQPAAVPGSEGPGRSARRPG